MLLQGTISLSGVTSSVVPLGTTLSVSSYQLSFSLGAAASAPPWVTSKTTSNFTINFAASYTGTVDWILDLGGGVAISGLPAGTTPTGAELVPAVQASQTVSLTEAQLALAALASTAGLTAGVTPTGSEKLPAIQSGSPVSLTSSQLASLVTLSGLGGTTLAAVEATITLAYLGGTTLAAVEAAINQAYISGKLYPQSASELAASVTPVNLLIPPPELTGLVVPDRYLVNTTPGTTAMDGGIADAIAVAQQLNGGSAIVQFFASTYLCTGQISLGNLSGISLRGVGGLTGGAGPGTLLKSTLTTATSFINGQGSHGIRIENLQIENLSGSTGYTGILIDFTMNASAAKLLNLLLSLGATGSHLALDTIVGFRAVDTQFDGGSISVQGQAHAGGSFSQVVKFDHCNWANTANIPIQDGGNAWKFDNCFWEGLSNGAAGAYTSVPGSNGMEFSNCWFGDETVAGTWINFVGEGLKIGACEVLGGGTTSTFLSLNNSIGFVVEGNEVYNIGTFVNFSTASCRAGSVKYNNLGSVTTSFANIANCDNTVELNPNDPLSTSTPQYSKSTSGWESDSNGYIRNWGSVIVSESGGTGSASVTFSKDPATLYGIKLTPNGSCNFWYSSASTSGFTINIANASTSITFFWEATGTL
jgi:hypothetical protein